MKAISQRKPLELNLVPQQLVQDFESSILECYCDYGYFEHYIIGEFVEDFAVYGESHKRTGNPYTLHDDEKNTEEDLRKIINDRYYDLTDDVMAVLDYYHMFYLQKEYFYTNHHNMPFTQIW